MVGVLSLALVHSLLVKALPVDPQRRRGAGFRKPGGRQHPAARMNGEEEREAWSFGADPGGGLSR
jgi:hypothetical protein